jgi:lysophospholipase L1-like esterase
MTLFDIKSLYFSKKIKFQIFMYLVGLAFLLSSKSTFANDSDVVNCGKSWRIVVLGSSTAYGTGASTSDSSWVSIYRRYVKTKNINSQVFNLGIPGYRTYQNLRPDGYIPPPNRPAPAAGFNITAALALNPDAILINMPSNDAASNYTVAEQMANFDETFRIADSAQIPIWVTTTQPRLYMSADQMQNLRDMRQWIIDRFGAKSVNFWDGIANPDGTVASLYYVDNVHVNNRGHEEFFIRMRSECILDSLCKRYQGSLTVNAGTDQTFQLPFTQLSLQGSAFSSKGTIISKNWNQISGPVNCQISDSTSFQTNITGIIPGVYHFELSVTDDRFNAVKDTIEIVVNCAAATQPESTDTTSICATQLPYVWNGNSLSTAGYHQITLSNSIGCDSLVSIYLIVNPCTISMNFKVFLEGFLVGNDSMNDKLFHLGISSDSMAVDSIQINLWKPSNINFATPDYSVNGILKKNGLLSIEFPGDITGRFFYFSVKHRNSMEIWSSDSVQVSNNMLYDFTDNILNTFSDGANSPQKQGSNNIFSLYGGDANQDGAIDLFDIQKVENDASNFDFGNQVSDCNGDGVVDLIDMQIVENNLGLFIFLARPY